ncbi:hypothetical protein E2562_036477 [Oryza meyeriana var. granulata]|uniref:Uncharacterized protein n=1 Tax=Oryza meyeriana var. granulata TaxID=110450 RepID=A0A6G1DTD6_9ORYZ|nr:hypothetical protein E2562_036477 [Oryza meyeriana var. granulata]
MPISSSQHAEAWRPLVVVTAEAIDTTAAATAAEACDADLAVNVAATFTGWPWAGQRAPIVAAAPDGVDAWDTATISLWGRWGLVKRRVLLAGGQQ